MAQDPRDLPAIPKGRVEHFVGGPTVYRRAVEAGVIDPSRTPTGREYVTPADFELAVTWAGEREKAAGRR
jgi:hypothetical protein